MSFRAARYYDTPPWKLFGSLTSDYAHIIAPYWTYYGTIVQGHCCYNNAEYGQSYYHGHVAFTLQIT